MQVFLKAGVKVGGFDKRVAVVMAVVVRAVVVRAVVVRAVVVKAAVVRAAVAGTVLHRLV
jgi:hypothetical protein